MAWAPASRAETFEPARERAGACDFQRGGEIARDFDAPPQRFAGRVALARPDAGMRKLQAAGVDHGAAPVSCAASDCDGVREPCRFVFAGCVVAGQCAGLGVECRDLAGHAGFHGRTQAADASLRAIGGGTRGRARLFGDLRRLRAGRRDRLARGGLGTQHLLDRGVDRGLT